MTTICDTGPLVAYLNRNDPYHGWAVTLMKRIRPRLLTCEPVLTEVASVLREDGMEPARECSFRASASDRMSSSVATSFAMAGGPSACAPRLTP